MIITVGTYDNIETGGKKDGIGSRADRNMPVTWRRRDQLRLASSEEEKHNEN
jgi:hypothetical protein